MKKEDKKLDEAARASWLYYIARLTQDEIAIKLNTSRQSVQRMIALATNKKLINFKLNHNISKCMELSYALKEKFNLKECDIFPSFDENSTLGLGEAGASVMEKYIYQNKNLIIGLGTGDALTKSINEISPKEYKEHKIISLVGNISRDGRASHNEASSKLSYKINSDYYPMPLPVITPNKEEKNLLLNQASIKNVINLATSIDIAFVGIGNIGKHSPLLKDGFINKEEFKSIEKLKFVGEIIGWLFNEDGNILNQATNERLTSIKINKTPKIPVIGIACGKRKVKAIKAALKGKLINHLVTNETTAKYVLKD